MGALFITYAAVSDNFAHNLRFSLYDGIKLLGRAPNGLDAVRIKPVSNIGSGKRPHKFLVEAVYDRARRLCRREKTYIRYILKSGQARRSNRWQPWDEFCRLGCRD